MSLEKARDLAKRAISEATHHDSASGGVCRVYHIHKTGWRASALEMFQRRLQSGGPSGRLAAGKASGWVKRLESTLKSWNVSACCTARDSQVEDAEAASGMPVVPTINVAAIPVAPVTGFPTSPSLLTPKERERRRNSWFRADPT